MHKLFVWASVLTYYFVYMHANKYQQEGAQVIFYNKKFVEYAQAITRRQRRGEPYKSNVTFTTLHAWGNNVTCEAAYRNRIMPTPIKLKLKMCDYTKVPWIVDFVKAYSNMTVACPLPAGTYTFSNIELPPKGFPLPILFGKIFLNYTCIFDIEKEVLMKLGIKLNID